MLDQSRRPLYQHLYEHSQKQSVRYHIPGHSGGDLYDEAMWKGLARWDVTETYGMDDLHAPDSLIREAEELAASAFGAAKTWFLVNGTSGGLLAALHGLFQRGDAVVVQRNAHISIYNGLMLAGLRPQYIMPEILDQGSIAASITLEGLKEVLVANPDVKGVIVTNPSYYGHRADIRGIAKLCRAYDKLLVVDEAHGAHYFFHPSLKESSAIYQGADVAVQSAHKTLPALTMGSLLHLGHGADGRVDLQRLAYYISVFQTTSPSYLVMASLDYARHWMVRSGEAELEKAFVRKQRLCQRIRECGLVPMDEAWANGYITDPLKLTISVAHTGMTGQQWEEELAKRQIFMELVSKDHMLLMLGLGQPTETDERLLQAILEIIEFARVMQRQVCVPKLQLPVQEPIVAVALSDTVYGQCNQQIQAIPLTICAGRVTAEYIIPYPPGIPLICPGEVMTAEHIRFIEEAKRAGIHFQGLADRTVEMVQCYALD